MNSAWRKPCSGLRDDNACGAVGLGEIVARRARCLRKRGGNAGGRHKARMSVDRVMALPRVCIAANEYTMLDGGPLWRPAALRIEPRGGERKKTADHEHAPVLCLRISRCGANRYFRSARAKAPAARAVLPGWRGSNVEIVGTDFLHKSPLQPSYRKWLC